MQEAAEFRTATIYNNIMYSLAGHVAETLEGRPWDDLLVDQLLKPLGDTELTPTHLKCRPVHDCFSQAAPHCENFPWSQ